MIMKLIKTEKDDDRVYFLCEYVQGIDLYDTLNEIGVLSDTQGKFYTACLLLVLEHFYEKRIVYRDLKPESITIDASGYPKFTEFSTAKIVKDRTNTQIGTPHYTSPEILKGLPYNHSTDLWSLGCMVYEFFCGKVPFGDDLEDPYAV